MLIKASACSIVAVLGSVVVLGSLGLAYAHVPTACTNDRSRCYETENEFPGNAKTGKVRLPDTAQFREKETKSGVKLSGVILFERIGDGKFIISEVTYRKQGTRAPIHVHPFGGQTCVVYGQMTLWLEDVAGTKFTKTTKKAGECYWMPPNQRMSGVNDGDTAAVMLDLFIVEGSEADPLKPDFPAVMVEEGFDQPKEVDTKVEQLDLPKLVEEAKKDESNVPVVLDDNF